jgi:hypothetical protein
MTELAELATEISGFISARAKRFFYASNFVKIVLVIGGSVVAGVAHFCDGEKLTAINIVGICASIVVGIGGIFLFISDRDTSLDLDAARRAIEKASEKQLVLDQEESTAFEQEREYESTLNRAIELYAAMDQMRTVVHSVLGAPGVDETAAIDSLLQVSSRSLTIASGFMLNEHWTIGVYKAETSAASPRIMLRCVAHLRSIPCNIAQARLWPEGVGVGGAAYASGVEIVVPDVLSEEIGNRYDISTMAKANDRARYRSLAAIPVISGTDPVVRPWGVVVATSDRPNHFHADHMTGIRTIEGARALAGMVGVVIRANMRSTALSKV